MKRIVTAIIAIVMVLSLSCAAFAAENEFVPSISEKGAPAIVSAVLVKDGEVIATLEQACLLITSVAEAPTSELLPEEAKNLLLNVYNELVAGTMTLPTDKNEELVIRDLVDLSVICEEHAAMLAEEGVSLQVTFTLGAAASDVIKVMSYKNEAWGVVETVNNGDGTVTATFEHLCPVAFAVSTMNDADDTGDAFRTELIFWMVAMFASAAALVVVTVRRKARA